MILVFAGCARTTKGERYNDGRVFFLIDLDPEIYPYHPGTPYQGTAGITYIVEGEEPVTVERFIAPRGQKFDLVGNMIEGGLEVSVSVRTRHQGWRWEKGISVIVDGNITLRLHLAVEGDRDSQLLLDIYE
jgi:hypothetical protein